MQGKEYSFFTPQYARLDTPCVLHYVAGRGIETLLIFQIYEDRTGGRRGFCDDKPANQCFAIVPSVSGVAPGINKLLHYADCGQWGDGRVIVAVRAFCTDVHEEHQ